MARTVVGIFDNESDAREAVQRMQKEGGIQGSNIDISSNRHGSAERNTSNDTNRSSTKDTHWDSRSTGIDTQDTPGSEQNTGEAYQNNEPDYNSTGSTYGASNPRQDNTWDRDLVGSDRNHSGNSNEGIFDRIGNFFSNLFGDTDDARRYTNASRNRTIVTVHAASQEQAEDAADILDECGAVDVHQQSNRGNVSSKDYKTTTTAVDMEKNTGGYSRSEVGRRSRIFDRPVSGEYRLSDDYYYDNNTDLDYDRNRASNLGGRDDERDRSNLK